MGCKPISIPFEQNVKFNVDESDFMEDTIMYKAKWEFSKQYPSQGQILLANLVMDTTCEQILLAKNPSYHAIIEVHYQFVREKLVVGEMNLIHVNIEDQVAYIFTKVLRINKLRKFRKMFGVLKVDLNLKGNIKNSNSTTQVLISYWSTFTRLNYFFYLYQFDYLWFGFLVKYLGVDGLSFFFFIAQVCVFDVT